MKFEDIRFEERITPYGKQQGLVMPGGFWVQKNTLQATWTQLHKNWPLIDWSKKQSAESMLSTEYWRDSHPGGARIAMGRCIKFFIHHDMLPIALEVANPSKKGKRFYRPSRV